MISESNQLSWPDFLLQCFVSHWVLTLFTVGVVAAIMAVSAKLNTSAINATTRHTIWLLTLMASVLMPLFVFVPASTKVEFFPAALLAADAPMQSPIPTTVRPSNTLTQLDADLDSTQKGRSASMALESDTKNQAEQGFASQSLENKSGGKSDVSVTPLNVSSSESYLPFQVVKTFLPTNSLVALQLLFVFWMLGVAVMWWRLNLEFRAARLLKTQSQPAPQHFERRFDRLCQQLDVSSRPVLRFHSGISAPMTVGFIRVWIAVPLSWRDAIDDVVFDQTLTHELGHVARKDALVNVLQKCLGVVFWLYPAFWYLSRQLELERESACDDWVLEHDGQSHKYAKNLIDVAETLYLQPNVLAVGCLRSPSQLSRRIQNLVSNSSDHALVNSWKLLIAVTLGLTTTLSVSAVAWPDFPSANKPVDVLAPKIVLKPSEPKRAKPVEVDLSLSTKKSMAPRVDLPSQPSPNSRTQETQKPQKPQRKGSVPIASPKDSLHNVTQNKVSKTVDLDTHNNTNDLQRLYNQTDDQHQPVLAALKKGDGELVGRLLDSGVMASPTAITYALANNRQELAKILLDAGTVADEHALVLAIKRKNHSMVNRLIQAGAGASSSSLTLAIYQDDHSLIDKLVKLGAKPDDNSLKMAINNSDEELLCRLLGKTGDLDSSLDLEEAAIHAIDNNKLSALRLLLDKGIAVTDRVYQAALDHHNVKILSMVSSYYQGNFKKFQKKNAKAQQKRTKLKSGEQHKDDFGFAIWPVHSAKMSLRYGESEEKYTGNKTKHYAIDFVAPMGSSVRAVASGRVVESTYSEGFGNYILVDHGDGYKTRYANNKENKVVKGDFVKTNDEIALVGTSAKRVAGPHLHFEVKFHQQKLNPEMLFTDVR